MVTVCALIAAFNEAPGVGDVVRGTALHASPVVVADDGSTDETAAKAPEAGAVVLRHDRNRGKGWAVRTGLEYALTQPCSHVLFLDGDLQHDPEELSKLSGHADLGRGDFI